VFLDLSAVEDTMLKELQIDAHAPWKQRFRAPTIFWTQIAKLAPTRGLAVSNPSGVLQLHAWNVTTGELKQLTYYADGKVFGLLSPDGRYVYYHEDTSGNEIGHFVRVPFEGGAQEDITPDLPLYSSFGLSISQAGNLIGFTVATPTGFQIHRLEVETDGKLGSQHQIFFTPRIVHGPLLSFGGEIMVLGSTERSGTLQFSLLAIDAANGQQMGELWDGPESSIIPWAFSPKADDFRLLATTDRTGVTRPLIWDARTGERIDLALDDLEGDVEPWDWSADGTRVLLCQFSQAVQHLYVYEIATKTLRALQHPSGSFLSFGGAGTYFGSGHELFAQWQDSTHPSQVIALDVETGAQTRTVLAAGEVPPGRPWHAFRFASTDGQMIQGWLAVPEGQGPFPTILETHGGPTAVQTDSFAPGSQAWLDHGFAYATINYRGSTTFGRDFERKIWGDLGHWEVEDMAAAREWLIEEGIARPDQLFLTGWSYGGYLTLLALGKRPELWAGGMAGIAIADWAVQYEDTADTLRGYQVALFGGTPQEKPEQYAASSPITYAERVRAPVLIIQGRNDTRTTPRPIEMYEQKMNALGKSIEVRWFESGHLGSFTQVEQSIEHQEWMLRFAWSVGIRK
jgi:dipeptidyl aminopeptidase/acylaminoacyl peptidase